MRDRLPAPGKANRVRIMQDDGKVIEGVLSYADDAVQEGSYYNRANVLPDDVCEILSINKVTAEPKDAFRLAGSTLDLRKSKTHRVPINNFGVPDTTINTEGNGFRLCISESYTNKRTTETQAGRMVLFPKFRRMVQIPNTDHTKLLCVDFTTGNTTTSIALDNSMYGDNTRANVLGGDEENSLIFVSIYSATTANKMYFFVYRYDTELNKFSLHYKSNELNILMVSNSNLPLHNFSYENQYAFCRFNLGVFYAVIYDKSQNKILKYFTLPIRMDSGNYCWTFSGKSIYFAKSAKDFDLQQNVSRIYKIDVQTQTSKVIYEKLYGSSNADFIAVFGNYVIGKFENLLLKYSLTTDAKIAEKENGYFFGGGYKISDTYLLVGTQILNVSSLSISMSLRNQISFSLVDQPFEPTFLYPLYALERQEEGNTVMRYFQASVDVRNITNLSIDISKRVLDMWGYNISLLGHSYETPRSYNSISRVQTSRLTPYMPIELLR